MPEERAERRLAAIFAADMVGYSRLMEADEAGVIARQKAHRAELIDPAIAEHNGRIVKTTGDGMLVEFASVVDAVACAVAIQRAMAAREDDVPKDHRIQYRVGINLGDIVIENDDIFGDGVNIASRLEGLAEPGGVIISGTAYDQLKAKVEAGYEFLGEQQVKNIAEPVRIYRALLDPEQAGKVIGIPRKPRRPRKAVMSVVALIAMIAVGAFWWHQAQPDLRPADTSKMTFDLPARPSIAILPFANLSGEPDQEFIADGFTETLLDVLAQNPGLFVIARTSVFTYKGKSVQVQQVAEEQGVRFVLEGSIQRSGDRIRVTAQLIDAIAGNHLWSQRYDRSYGELFALQDEITLKIAQSLDVQLLEGGGRGTLSNVEAWSYMIKARSLSRKFNKADNLQARGLVEKALKLELNNASVYSLLGFLHLQDALRGFTATPKDSFGKAVESAHRAIELDPDLAHGHIVLATILLVKRDFDGALAEARKALELAPTSAGILGGAAHVLFLTGQHNEVVALEEKAMRLSPFFPSWHYMYYARSLTFLGRYDDAIAAAQSGVKLAESVNNESVHRMSLAFIYADKGDLDQAKKEMAKARELRPTIYVSDFRKYWNFKDESESERFFGALLAAGLPESGK